jgi:cbb3-type cytochrome oxidase subunit 3
MIFTSILDWLLEYSVALVGLVFLLMVVSVYWPSRKDTLQRHAMIPFDDDK